jgi:hypothetical protein
MGEFSPRFPVNDARPLRNRSIIAGRGGIINYEVVDARAVENPETSELD